MAKKKIIEIEANTDDALKDIKELFKTLLDEQKKAKDNQDKLNDEVAGLKKASKKASGGLKLVSNGFKVIGTAIKAAGIGLLIGAFVTLKGILEQNQVVVDAFAKAFDGVSSVFNTVVTTLVDVFKNVSETTGGFDALQKVVGGSITIVFNNFKLLVLGLIGGFKQLKVAYETVFGDDKSIKAAKDSLIETQKAIGETIKSTAKAAKEVKDNISEAIDEVGTLATEVGDAVGKIDFKDEFKQGTALQSLRNGAKLAVADLQILKERLDRQAELQRQIRDDESKSITERQAANAALIKTLKDQEKAAVDLANANLAAANAELATDPGNIDKQVAAKLALAEVEAERVTVAGLMSEALVNQIALEKEANELVDSQIEAQNDLLISQQEFDAARNLSGVERLEKLREIAAEETRIEEERLQKLKDNAKEGTQAFIDADNELKAFKEERRQEDIEAEEEIAQAKLDKIEEELENDQISFEEKRELLAERQRILDEDEALTAEERNERLAEQTQLELDLDQQKLDSKRAAVNGLSQIFGQETALGKALLVTKQALAAQQLILDIKTTINEAKEAAKRATTKGAEAGADIAAGAAKTASASPFPANIPMIIGYAATAVGIIGSVVSAVKKVKGAKSSAAGGGGGGAATPAKPSFNIVGQGGSNQVADVIASTTANTPPVQAFVVGSEVTTQQALDRNIEDSASIL